MAIVEAAGYAPTVVEYLSVGWTGDQLRDLSARAGACLRDLLREKGAPAGELGLADGTATEDQILEATVATPILVDRPIDRSTPSARKMAKSSRHVPRVADLPSGAAMITLRLITNDEGAQAAALHRRAGALIPGYDTSLHSEAEFAAFYRDRVMVEGPVWGAFEDAILRGHLALLPGWIDHLYVDTDFHGQGIGGALVRLAQNQQDELRLYTFQSNLRARTLYQRHGFLVEELTDGARNEEKMPDVTYHWRRR